MARRDKEVTGSDFIMDFNLSSIQDIGGIDFMKPEFLGLPPLEIVRDEGETEDSFRERQNQTLKEFVEKYLKVIRGGKPSPIKVIPPQLEFLADAFYRRQRDLILIKNRGGGGSLTAAILMWLCAVYQGRSSMDIAGSGDQAEELYRYTVGFWECLPMAQQLLTNDPNKRSTSLRNGAFIKAIPNSEKRARGPHPELLVCDEACQSDASSDRTLESVLQVNITHKDYTTVLLSTFHVAGGLFEDYVNNAADKGFKIYKWDIFDTMEKCVYGLEHATEEDPYAIETFCKKDYSCGGCPLTFKKMKTDPETGASFFEYLGCGGKARHSDGFIPVENALKAIKMNRREAFIVEHCSGRPMTAGPVFESEHLDVAFSPTDLSIVDRYKDYSTNYSKGGVISKYSDRGFLGHYMSVGIDWGFVGMMTCVGPVIRREEYLGDFDSNGDPIDDVLVLKDVGWSRHSTQTMIQYLHEMREQYGYFVVMADSSHPFNNRDLEVAGFDVIPVYFNTVKEKIGLPNLVKLLEKHKIKINKHECEGLTSTIRKYRRDDKGRIVKRDDHFVDALMCATVRFIFEKEFMYSSEDDAVNVSFF